MADSTEVFGSAPENLGKGERFQFRYVCSSRHGLGDALHQSELLRTREQELSVLTSSRVYGHLEVAE
jgi:hypothetical protein